VKRTERGFILIALLIAMVVLALLVAALVSLNVTKYLSEPLYTNSTKAFYIAQGGIEYCMRRATDCILDNSTCPSGVAFCSDPAGFITALGPQNFGNGTFKLSIDITNPSNYKLTSVGTIVTGGGNTSKRTITVENFTQFLPPCDCCKSNNPAFLTCGCLPQSGNNAPYTLNNHTSCALNITRMDIAKSGGTAQARATRIGLNGIQVWSGSTMVSTNPASPTAFIITAYNLPIGSSLDNYIRCNGANQVPGHWYITFYFRDCSNNPQTVTIDFTL
jgi:hypothetical protein